MRIQRLYTKNSLRNYDYILTTTCGKVIVVDPSDPSLLESLLRKVDYYFITHEHPDHIAGLDGLKSLFGGKVVAYEGQREQIPVDIPMGEGGYLPFEHEAFRIIFIPGHIMSHIGFILIERGKEKAAFLGDTLFNGGVGNTHSGNSRVLYRTISEKILTLNPQLILYPEHDYWETNLRFTLELEPDNTRAAELLARYQSEGHKQTGMFPMATLGEEKEYNLFFRAHLPHVQSAVRQRCQLSPHCSEEEVFVALRLLRDQWS